MFYIRFMIDFNFYVLESKDQSYFLVGMGMEKHEYSFIPLFLYFVLFICPYADTRLLTIPVSL